MVSYFWEWTTRVGLAILLSILLRMRKGKSLLGKNESRANFPWKKVRKNTKGGFEKRTVTL